MSSSTTGRVRSTAPTRTRASSRRPPRRCGHASRSGPRTTRSTRRTWSTSRTSTSGSHNWSSGPAATRRRRPPHSTRCGCRTTGSSCSRSTTTSTTSTTSSRSCRRPRCRTVTSSRRGSTRGCAVCTTGRTWSRSTATESRHEPGVTCSTSAVPSRRVRASTGSPSR